MLIAVPGGLKAQATRYRPAANYTAGGKADQSEGAKILSDFRQAGIAGTYWLEFQLRVMPRKGDERTLKGHLLGSRNEHGPISRLTLAGGDGGIAAERRWLIQSGPKPAAWQWAGDTAKTAELAAGDAFTSIGGTDLTLFDLQMPFIYWPDFIYEGVAKVRGRPAHSFLFYPPADLAAARPALTGVRVLLDTQFQALVQAELLGAKGASEKTISILDLKKTGEQWIVKSIDLRNNLTRDKTRITFTAASLNLTLPADTFSPDALAQEPLALAEAKIERF
ncbi:outer membrane lipoprotein-sorting protein [Oleiharenicola lentus]|uniref:outer membrane lipoprotein-sorting protein n=1 Tax=Oleiharenicola lentus TaxID=2508720 RepID=UPI003F66DA6A